MSGARIDGYLVCGGKYHDMDFARLELLKLLAEDERIRMRVAEDYRDAAAIREADFLITYTCDVVPGADELEHLQGFLDDGRRWFALHGTNSVLRFLKGKGWDAPRSSPRFMQMLGSQFIAHPPIHKYTVTVAAPDHPLVAGVEPFETDDELYLCEYHGDNQVLLETRFTGEAEGFVENEWHDDTPRQAYYLHSWGKGEVLYLTLGHCRGKYDMQPLMEEYPQVGRGSWELPVFYELLRRGIRWVSARH